MPNMHSIRTAKSIYMKSQIQIQIRNFQHIRTINLDCYQIIMDKKILSLKKSESL